MSTAVATPEVQVARERDVSEPRWNIAESGKKFRCRMIEPGLVSYVDQGGGIELLRKETLDQCLNTAVGNPLTIGHVDVTSENRMDVENGIVEGGEHCPEDGWFYVYGTVDTEDARSRIRRGQAPSCGYKVTQWGPGGTYHGIKYDREITGLVFNHLAIVEKPRYEKSNFRLNSQSTASMNVFKFFRKLVTRENGADVTKVETVELPLDAELELAGGNRIKVNSLLDEGMKAAACAVRTMSMDDEVEIDGKRVKMNALVDCYKKSNEKRDNAAEAEAARRNALTQEQRDAEDETKRRNALTPEQRQAEDDAAKRKNEQFITLHQARFVAQTTGGFSTSPDSLRDKVERGSKRY